MIEYFINTFIKFFFILTPFFVLSTFLSMTSDFEEKQRKKTAVKVTISTIIASLIIYFIGNQIFSLFGITINSFRIGTGALLFLSAYSLVKGVDKIHISEDEQDIAVVPLSIPVAIGPATTGAILILGSERNYLIEKSIGVSALILAIIAMGSFLYMGSLIEKIFKKQGLIILSKLTGLIVAAISAQMIMTGIVEFLK